MFLSLLLIIMVGISPYACQNLPQKNHRQLASLIDCANYATSGGWSYIIYDVDFKCYDSNPDQTLYNQSGNLLIQGGQQIYLASKEKVFTCAKGCIACFGPSISDCIICVSPSRGSMYTTVANILAKAKYDCSCRSGFVDIQGSHCQCPNGRYQVVPTDPEALWECLVCPFVFQTCSFNSGNNQVNPLTCKTGVGRKTDPNLLCACETGYHENYQIVTTDCFPDCQKPCSLCQSGSSTQCSQCFDSIMIYNSTTFTCTCPSSFYMNPSDFRCYACDYTCQTCNGGSNGNCQSCITTSLRFLQSGYCICPEHYVMDSQLNCVQCDWSCDTCYSINSCQSCMANDNRQIGASGFCVCQNGYAEDLGSSTCVQCQYTCLTCAYQFDSCSSCPLNSMRYLINSQCQCQDYYYDVGDLVCQQCDFTCKQCDGPLSNNCINCDIQSNRYLNNLKQCICMNGYGYIDQSTLECQQCNFSCLTCDQFDVCLTCPQNSFRILDDNNQCSCDVGYYEYQSQLQCLQCHYTCQTCDGQGPDKCLSCNYDLGREIDNSSCKCSSGFYEFYKICAPCFYTCLSCINQFQDGCIDCPLSRQLLNGQCVCKSIAQIDDGKSLECSDCHYTCQTCYGMNSNNCLTCYDNSSIQFTISRQIKYGVCSCPQYWFDDGQNEFCQQCHYSCSNCFDKSAQGCITCSDLDFRAQLSNSCFCMSGYFEVQQQTCSKCDYRCETCISDQTNCLTCPVGSLRILISQDNAYRYSTCACPSTEPNDVQDNPICQACHFSCSNCTSPQSNFCTVCSDSNNRLLSSDSNGSYCYCKDSYYEIGFSECASCSSLCFNCLTTASNCTKCDPTLFRVLSGNTCICASRFGTQQLSYYDNLLDPECVACHYSCFTCSGGEYNQCLSCSNLDFRYQQGSECLCNPKYIDNGEVLCMSCNYSCDTCEGTKYYCTSCPSGSLRSLNVQSQSCECPLGYYDAGITICQKCDIICDSCSDQSTTCLSCVIGSNRVYNQLTYYCDCLQGYYDAGDGTCGICHLSCFQCTGPLETDCSSCPDFLATKRVYITNSCLCADQYYDDLTNKICQICSPICDTCQYNKNTCTQCLNSQNRILSVSSCVCLSKYYDSGSEVCQQCSEYCLECQNASTQCTQCDSTLNRHLKQQNCQCLDGFYDEQQLQCQQCHNSCLTCINISTNCTTCDQNDYRELNNGQCICMQGSIELGTKQCGICDSRCNTCNNISTECLSCDSNQYRILVGKQCVCIDGYFENSIRQCQPCNQQCQTCINNEFNCTSCSLIDHKVIGNLNNCICQNGYYTDSNNNCQICSNLCLQCQGSATNCTSCNMMRVLVNNSCQCLDGSYNSGTGCIFCSYTCLTCSISANNCLSCSSSSKRSLQGSQCLCQPGYYDIGAQICQKCRIQCLTCSNSTICQTCDLSQFRIQNGNQCPCQQGYYDDGSALCQICDKQCATCIDQSNKCTSCNVSNTFRIDQSSTFNKCPCNVGFYDDQTQICKKCSYQCINCVGQATNCTVCNNNPGYYRINILPTCICQDGYFDDGIQIICQKCNFKCQTCIIQSENCLQCENPISRNPSPLCDCSSGYYLEIQSQKCLECSMQCQTCSDSANNCKSCKPDRITQKCLCQEGYYEANLQTCQQCSSKCQTCENHQLNCQLCASNRINPPNCICKEHYYDDQINIECQECDQFCGKCDFNGCIDCAANRIQNGKTCLCPIASVSYTDTPWCSNCDVAVVQGMFSDDLTSVIYKFEFPILFYFPFQIEAQEYCEKLILQSSLLLLGSSPQCITQNQNLIIELGDGASILVNDTIEFNPTFLKHTQCNSQLTKIFRTQISLPLNLIKPSIVLEYPQIPISPCSQNSININKQFITGDRNLIIKWSSSVILKEIDQANQYQFQTLSIQQGSLPENSLIDITVLFTNFLGQSDQLTIKITTLSSSTPQFQFQGTTQKFLLWTPIKIMVYYSNQICSKTEIKQVTNDIEITFQEIIIQRLPSNSNPVKFTQSQFHLTDSENIVYSIIPAGTLSINSNYSIQASYKDPIQNIYLTIQKDIQIQRSPLLIQIAGGSRVQNYLKAFTVQIQSKDPDFQTEWNTDEDITVEVSCMDIQRNNQPCKDIYNKTIPLNSTSFTQNIGKRLFNPYSVIIFKAVCKKQNLISTDQVSIILLDADLPSLDVKYPLGYKIRDVNINEQLQFEMQLTNNQFLKNIQFSYALIYNYEIVFVQFMPNQKLKFKMWDHFIDFGFVNKISVRLQAHDINYLMPSTLSIQLSINMPPVMSIVSIQPQLGNSFFTQFKMKVQNAKDSDSPIQYRFAYYQSESLQNIDTAKAKQDNLIIIQDFSSSQTFNGILESGELIILISVADSYGSTRNYTQQVSSLSFNEQIQSLNISCTQLLTQFNDQVYDYNQQIILVQELIKLNNQTSSDCLVQSKSLLNKFKQSLEIKMQSQTNINIQLRINNILSQLYDTDIQNKRRTLETESEITCYDVNQGQLVLDTLKKITNQNETSQLSAILDSLQAQIEKTITQNKNLLSDYQSSIDIGDEQTFRTLQQNFKLRQSLIKVLGSLYQQADQSKLNIRNLVNQLIDSFQKNLEIDQSGIKLATTSIGVQTNKISQINYQNYVMADQDGDEILDLSTYQINRIVQISRYSDNFYFSQQQFQDQFKNGTYLISEIDNNNSYKSKSIIPLQQQLVYDPFIYVDRDTIITQVKRIFSGKLIFNMKEELDKCNQNQQNNKSINKYSFVCSTYDGEWKFNQCQIEQQINNKGKVVFYCYCKTLNPITLMILNETNLNKTKLNSVNKKIEIDEYIDIGLSYNIYNIIILGYLAILIVVMIVYSLIKKITITSYVVLELERISSEEILTLTQQPQMSKEVFKKNFKYLHELSRLMTTRYTYLSQPARIMLIMFNISIPLATLNVSVAILGSYFISVALSMIVGPIFQIVTKIVEGFFTGPKVLKIVGYVFIIILNLGIFILNSFINKYYFYIWKRVHHYLILDILSGTILLIILYAPIEILIQYIRLTMGFQIYKQLKVDPMNPILNFIYYFLQDEILICIVKGANLI